MAMTRTVTVNLLPGTLPAAPPPLRRRRSCPLLPTVTSARLLSLTTLLMTAVAVPVAAGLEIISHRGANNLAPENTLASQRLAYELGTDYVEVDVRITSDLVPVVLHDPTVDRTTNGTGNVITLTLQQVKALDAGSWFHPRFAAERIPTLAESLATAKAYNRKLLMDIKGQYLAPQVVEAILQSGIPLNQIAFLTWWEGMTEGYTSRLPGVKVMVPPQLPITGSQVTPADVTNEVLMDLRRQKVTSLFFGFGYVSKADNDRFHAAGFQVSTIYQSPKLAYAYQDLGIDLFWTDATDIAVSSMNRLDQQWSGWAEAAGLAPDQANSWQDLDGDGMNNLMEYALGANPLTADASTPQVNRANNTLNLSLNLRENWSQFVSVTPQFNNGTGAWTELPGSYLTPVSPTRLDFHAPIAPGKQFFRMKFDFVP